MDSDKLVQCMIDKLDVVITSLADVRARLLAVEKCMNDHASPCEQFRNHLEQHEASTEFYRAMVGKIASGVIVAGLLAILGAALYAFRTGMVPHP